MTIDSDQPTSHRTRADFFREYRLLPLTRRAVMPAFENNRRLSNRTMLVFAIRTKPRLIAELVVGLTGVTTKLFQAALPPAETIRLAEWVHWWLTEPVDETNWWHMAELADGEIPAETGGRG